MHRKIKPPPASDALRQIPEGKQKRKRTTAHPNEECYHRRLQEMLDKITNLENRAKTINDIVDMLRDIAPKKMSENDESQNHNQTLVDTHIGFSTELLDESSNGEAQNLEEQSLYKVYQMFCIELKKLHEAKNNLTKKSKTAEEQKQITSDWGICNR